jgi:CHAT domain-containing protein/tetratricopeptide (TPR) repeat protein
MHAIVRASLGAIWLLGAAPGTQAPPVDPAARASALLAQTPAGREDTVPCDGLDDPTATALIAAGEQARDGSALARAAAAFRLAARAARCAESAPVLGAALNDLADVLFRRGDLDAAVAAATESVRIHDDLHDPAGLAQAWNNVANIRYTRGDMAGARDAETRSLDLWTAAGDVRGQARAFNNLGNVHRNLGELDAALDSLTRALDAFDRLGDRRSAAVVTDNIGVTHFWRGEYATALDYSRRALEMQRQLGNQYGVAKGLDSIGNIDRALGAYGPALASFQEALAIRTSLGDHPGVMETAHNIGLVHFSQGDYQLAIDAYARGLRLNRALHDRSFDAEALRNIGAAAWRLGQPVRAEADFRESLAITRREHFRTLEGELLDDLGQVALARGRAADAARQFTAALALRREIGDQAGVTESLTSLASARLAGRQTESALDLAQQATANARAHDQPELVWRAQTIAGMANRRLGRTAAARAALGDATDSLERLSASVAGPKALEQRFFEDKLSPYHELIALALDERAFGEAFELAERSKARALTTLLRGNRPASATTAPPVTPADAGPLLADRTTAILEYVVADRRLFALLLTGAGPNVTVEGRAIDVGATDLLARADRFRQRISTRDFDVRADARALYDTLLGPFAGRLAGISRLIVVPDGALWDVPFQALRGPAGYLIETTAVSYAPSIAVLREIRRLPRPAGARTLLVMAKATFDPVSTPALGPLPDADAQARALRDVYGPDRSAVFAGPDATEGRFAASAPHFSVLHLATHGVLDEASPLYSYLALTPGAADDPGDDGRLEAREIMRMKIPADLVVLAACDTGRGRIAPGEGVIGMMWALFAAGTRSMVVSQFPVESTSATALLVGLHRRLAAEAGGSKTADLRAAALDLLHTPRFAHPYYWAGFMLVGDPD